MSETDILQIHRIKAGVSQESVLGPTSLNIYCHNIPLLQHCQLAIFADDTAILKQNQALEFSMRDLQNYLDKLSIWFLNWKGNNKPNKKRRKIIKLRKYTNPTLLQINNYEIK